MEYWDKVDKLIEILEGGKYSIDQLMNHFDVTRRTIYRYLSTIEEMDIGLMRIGTSRPTYYTINPN